jgi:hypothetical protein
VSDGSDRTDECVVAWRRRCWRRNESDGRCLLAAADATGTTSRGAVVTSQRCAVAPNRSGTCDALTTTDAGVAAVDALTRALQRHDIPPLDGVSR